MSFVDINTYGSIGELVLSSPATLNALRHEDIKAMSSGLAQLEADSSVKAIVVRSDTAKALCAGGDMKQIRENILAGKFDRIDAFFTDEYALNLAISRCKKPYIALMQGITMGGGLGISVHGHFRIVTENSMLAMPESRIGFFPDVGGSFILPRLPYRSGYWLGLTGASVKGYEAVLTGLATHLVPASEMEALIAAIDKALATSPSDSIESYHQAVSSAISAFATQPDNDEFTAIAEQREAWFADDSLDAIRTKLSDSASSGNADAQQLLDLLDAGSPYSAKITLQLFEEAKGKDLADCLKLELALAAEAVRYPDCAEGVRAVLVDKDRNPNWQ